MSSTPTTCGLCKRVYQDPKSLQTVRMRLPGRNVFGAPMRLCATCLRNLRETVGERN